MIKITQIEEKLVLKSFNKYILTTSQTVSKYSWFGKGALAIFHHCDHTTRTDQETVFLETFSPSITYCMIRPEGAHAHLSTKGTPNYLNPYLVLQKPSCSKKCDPVPGSYKNPRCREFLMTHESATNVFSCSL